MDEYEEIIWPPFYHVLAYKPEFLSFESIKACIRNLVLHEILWRTEKYNMISSWPHFTRKYFRWEELHVACLMYLYDCRICQWHSHESSHRYSSHVTCACIPMFIVCAKCSGGWCPPLCTYLMWCRIISYCKRLRMPRERVEFVHQLEVRLFFKPCQSPIVYAEETTIRWRRASFNFS